MSQTMEHFFLYQILDKFNYIFFQPFRGNPGKFYEMSTLETIAIIR